MVDYHHAQLTLESLSILINPLFLEIVTFFLLEGEHTQDSGIPNPEYPEERRI